MTRRLTNQLLDATVQAARLAAIDQSAQLRFGTVTAYTAGTKTINCTVAGEDVAERRGMRAARRREEVVIAVRNTDMRGKR